MKQILVDKNFNLYKKGDSPEELADKVLSAFLGRKVLKSDLPISPFSILNASGANFLFLDFDRIEKGSEQKMPKYMEWYGAMGLIITLVWLYIEFLRLLSKLNSKD